LYYFSKQSEPDSNRVHIFYLSTVEQFLGICTLLEYHFWGVLMTLPKYI